MLNSARVLKYIKSNLGGYRLKIELTDEEILDYVKEFSLRTFSKYIPDVGRTVISPTNPNTHDSLITNKFFIEDEDGLEIIGVKELVDNLSGDLVLGHPYVGVYSYDELPSWTLQVDRARSAKLFSLWDVTFDFQPPNIIEVWPTPTQSFCVIYERIHNEDFSTIPIDLQDEFLRLCLADIKIQVGQVRSKYGGGALNTPFGSIPLGSEILSEGKDERREIIEKLEGKSHPNITIDIG
jgi:hypothetical protein